MGGGRETYVYLWLIHDDVWQKSTQYCNYPIKNKLKKKKMAEDQGNHCEPNLKF